VTQAPPPPPPVVPVPDVETARASLRSARDALEATIARAASFTEVERNQRVDDEWSTVESIRHLVFVLDVWHSKTIGGETDPFHPIGLPPSFIPAKPPGTSVDPDARPTFDEAAGVLRARLANFAAYIQDLEDADLSRDVPAHAKTVGGALNVIFTELGAHNHFINRDLDAIERSRATDA
jgi:hypothetical protein